ncbi:hypothetical protein ACWEFJ_13750 [Actinosynnema sp. NPDC004786]
MSRSATATLTALGVGAAGELTAAPARTLPVRGELAGLLPWGGLRRGSTVSVRGATSLLLALVAEATAEGCWAAVVGLPGCGALAAAELGVAVHRLALVPRPGRDQGEVEKTVAALLDGFDLVAVATPVTPATARKLAARTRNRKSVLLPFTIPWPGADVELTATSARWSGLEAGHGLLTTRTITVRATGRGAAARPRQTTFLLPGTTAPTPPKPSLVPVPTTAPPSAGAPAPTGAPPLAGAPALAGASPLTGAPALNGAPPLASAPALNGAPPLSGESALAGGPALSGEPAPRSAGPSAPPTAAPLRPPPAALPLAPPADLSPTADPSPPAAVEGSLPPADPLPWRTVGRSLLAVVPPAFPVAEAA